MTLQGHCTTKKPSHPQNTNSTVLRQQCFRSTGNLRPRNQIDHHGLPCSCLSSSFHVAERCCMHRLGHLKRRRSLGPSFPLTIQLEMIRLKRKASILRVHHSLILSKFKTLQKCSGKKKVANAVDKAGFCAIRSCERKRRHHFRNLGQTLGLERVPNKKHAKQSTGNLHVCSFRYRG